MDLPLLDPVGITISILVPGFFYLLSLKICKMDNKLPKVAFGNTNLNVLINNLYPAFIFGLLSFMFLALTSFAGELLKTTLTFDFIPSLEFTTNFTYIGYSTSLGLESFALASITLMIAIFSTVRNQWGSNRFYYSSLVAVVLTFLLIGLFPLDIFNKIGVPGMAIYAVYPCSINSEKFLFIANTGSDAVEIYAIKRNDGANPLPLEKYPLTIASNDSIHIPLENFPNVKPDSTLSVFTNKGNILMPLICDKAVFV